MADTKRVLATQAGTLEFLWNQGNLRAVKFDGVEIVRGLSAPVRDAGWGTLGEAVINDEEDAAGNGWKARCVSRLSAMDAEKTVTVDIAEKGNAVEIVARFALQANERFESNRAGFCVLHPLEGVRGTPVDVTHSDGTTETVRFPETIMPGQPIFDICGLSSEIAGVKTDFRFEGEIFEMEDQRNWSDASYKTYCRPLALPLPIRIAPGARLIQTITITVSGGARAGGPAARQTRKSVRLPGIRLAVEPQWLARPPVEGDGFTVRAGTQIDWSDADIARLKEMIGGGGVFDLELAIADPEKEIAAFAARLAAHGLTPERVVALPLAYMKSYQPSGPWPDPPGPEEAAEIAAHAFPNSRIGVGMLTNFTEFNRCPPPSGVGAFVTYSTTAIVHAADDRSVLETLEALPDIFASAGKLAGGRPQRLGLVAIPMRSNPYGPGLVEPDPSARSYVTMTERDARHAGALGAIFAAAAVIEAAEAGVESLCLAAPSGPFGLTDERGNATPLARLIAALGRFDTDKLKLARQGAHECVLSDDTRSLTVRKEPDDPVLIIRDGSDEEVIR
jgi:D-apionolactonase